MTTADALRILLVEDDEDDYLLTREHARGTGRSEGSSSTGSRATRPR